MDVLDILINLSWLSKKSRNCFFFCYPNITKQTLYIYSQSADFVDVLVLHSASRCLDPSGNLHSPTCESLKTIQGQQPHQPHQKPTHNPPLNPHVPSHNHYSPTDESLIILWKRCTKTWLKNVTQRRDTRTAYLYITVRYITQNYLVWIFHIRTQLFFLICLTYPKTVFKIELCGTYILHIRHFGDFCIFRTWRIAVHNISTRNNVFVCLRSDTNIFKNQLLFFSRIIDYGPFWTQKLTMTQFFNVKLPESILFIFFVVADHSLKNIYENTEKLNK